MPKAIATFLMFTGTAEQAMNRYVSLFPGSEITQIERWGAGEGLGAIKRAHFTLRGQQFMCSDSPIRHEFTFTPSMSIFVDCESEAELDAAFAQLSADGQVLMPPDNYGFSRKFTWVNDSFGVSWQLNLA